MKQDIEVASTIEPLDALLIADKNKFKQVLYNLLSNAIKFTPPSGQVELKAVADAEVLRITVQDSGIGIPKELQHKIFGAFYQVQSSSSREYPGTGLGLALTKKLVELHGGTIEFDSAPEREPPSPSSSPSGPAPASETASWSSGT